MLTAICQVLVTADLPASRAFYERHFDLSAVFDAGWYVHLAAPHRPDLQLGLVAAGHESVPPGETRPNRSAIVTVQVDDVDAAFRTLRAAGADVIDAPRDEAWGQRHFFCTDPAGFLVDVVAPIAPTAEFASACQRDGR